MKKPDRPPMRRAARAGNIIGQLFEARGLDRKLREYRAWELWEEVVGRQIAAHARPARLRDDILEVVVDQPIWMQQLRLMAPQILAKLNRALGEELIRDIFWRRGTVKAAESPPEPSKAPPLPPLNAEESAAVERIAAALADPDLREGLSSLLKLQARADKRRKTPDQD